MSLMVYLMLYLVFGMFTALVFIWRKLDEIKNVLENLPDESVEPEVEED